MNIPIFTKVLLLNLLLCNVPFEYFGLFLGWPIALVSALIHSFVTKHGILKSTNINMISVLVGSTISYYIVFNGSSPDNDVGLGYFISTMYGFGIITLILSSILTPVILNYKLSIVRK